MSGPKGGGRGEAAKGSADNSTTSKWWVDIGAKEKVRNPRPPGPAGMSFFQVARDFDQEKAREQLTDNNLTLLNSMDLPEGQWSYVKLAEQVYPKRELERVKGLVELPAYARGVVVDSGRMIRLLVTGKVVGERILELTLGESPSFDCWVDHEWVREEVFDDGERAMRAFRRFIRTYLAPEAVARHAGIVARV